MVPDPLPGHEGNTHLRDVYFGVDPDYAGRFTVPVLFDKKAGTIVSNESSEILRMLGHVFDAQLPAGCAAVDRGCFSFLCPHLPPPPFPPFRSLLDVIADIASPPFLPPNLA